MQEEWPVRRSTAARAIFDVELIERDSVRNVLNGAR